MATLADIFTGDGFSVYTLSSAVQKLPYTESIFGSMGIFRNIPVPTTTVAVEEEQGKLTLVPTTHRSGPGIPHESGKRKVRSFTIPHIQVDDHVTADEVLNIRAFGSTDVASGAAQVVARKLEMMRKEVEATQEYLRLGSILGVITYPTNSVTADVNLFTEFDTTQATVNWALDTVTTNVRGLIQASLRSLRTALGGSIPTGYIVACGEAFMDVLVNHDLVRADYLQCQAQYALQQASRIGFGAYRRQFVFDGVTFIEYPASILGKAHLTTTCAVMIPLGVDAYQAYIGPSDYPEAAGTLGQEFYANQWLSEDGKRINLSVQSNYLPLNCRPRAAQYITKT